MLGASLIGFQQFSASAQINDSIAQIAYSHIHNPNSTSVDTIVELTGHLVDYFKENKERCKQSEALIYLSILHSKRTEYEPAMQGLVQAERIIEEFNCDSVHYITLYHGYSVLYTKMRDNEKNDSVCFLGISKFNLDWPNKSTLVRLYLGIGKHSSDMEWLLPIQDSALKLAREYDYPSFEQKALIDIGTTYAMNNLFDEASVYFKKALAVAKRIDNKRDLGVLYNNLAGLTNDPEEVLPFIDSALYYSKASNDLNNYQVFMGNKAMYYTMIGDYKTGYKTLYRSMVLKDSLFNLQKFEAVAQIEEKYEAEKKSNEIKSLKLDKLNIEVQSYKYKKNRDQLIIGVLGLLAASFLLGYGFYINRKNRRRLAIKNELIEVARKKSDDLLLNILPEEIAEELKEKGKAGAKQLEDVSILFTDLIDFTRKSENMDTDELLEELNYCFKGFDLIIQDYKVEKIKTIGDSYMAASGLPRPSSDSTSNIILAALDMQAFMEKRVEERKKAGKEFFEMRSGIHNGPIVAGIVGVKKFQYDIWGDAVNTASRMESSGIAYKVNISSDTYAVVKDDPQFSFEDRGLISAKGKGKIHMYFVSRKNPKLL